MEDSFIRKTLFKLMTLLWQVRLAAVLHITESQEF